NQLEGPLPPELGKLTRLKRLLLSGNNFTRTLPTTFANLKNLTDFRIDGTNISGRIPDFIGNWTKLDRLDMQGRSMAGPIPSPIFHLKNMTELRVSDLMGPNMPFPDLRDMSNMVQLVLRNCLINGSIPPNIGELMPGIKNLDLSFNRLTGDVQRLQEIPSLLFLYLTNNSLTGQVPTWITNTKQNFDLSYNNFTGSSQDRCQDSNLNKISSYSTEEDKSIAWCLKKGLPCFTNSKSDLSPMGPSSFYSSSDKCACSTGEFVGSRRANYYTQASPNMTDRDLYSTARISPLSLKYYVICLRSGNYKVKLHFAEIVFSIDQRAGGIGTRIFDVSIQGKRFLKDFDIEEEAKGVGKSIVKEYDVDVTSSTLEIHLYWAGKGTTFIHQTLYMDLLFQPLQSHQVNFDPNTGHMSVGVTGGIVAALFCSLFPSTELRDLLQAGYYTLRQIKAATSNFAVSNKIGEGGFRPVYKGVLPDGLVISVKQLSAKSKQGNREFVNEIGMISALKHPYLVNLFGCYVEGNKLLLIYEFGARPFPKTEVELADNAKDCLDIDKGLAYLHEESRLKIVHRDIKATNILLDKDLTAKISDFGLAKHDKRRTPTSAHIVCFVLYPTCRGYMAPEYAMRGYLTYKADVYSFVVVALEIVSGKSNTKYMPKDEFVHLLDWVMTSLIPFSKSTYSTEEVLRMLNIALLCTNPSASLRPLMSAVVGMLEGRIPVPEPLAKHGARADDMRFRAFKGISYDSQTHTSTSSLGTTQIESKSLMGDGRQVNRTMSHYSDQEEQEEKQTS
ncbi:hypothetical protein MKX01_026517, partial [Papaver californicum]